MKQMWKRAVLIAGALLVSAVTVLAVMPMPPGNWHKTLDAARRDAAEKKSNIIVDLYAEWCGWCKRLEKDVYPQPVFQDYAKTQALLRIDTEDRKEGTEIARKYQAQSLPTTLILDVSGIEVGRVTGYMQAPQYVLAIKQQIAQYEPFRKRLEEEKAHAKDAKYLLDLALELLQRRAPEQAETRIDKVLRMPGLDAAVRGQAAQVLLGLADSLGAARAFAKAEAQYERILGIRGLEAAIKHEAGYRAAVSEILQGKAAEAKAHVERLLEGLRAAAPRDSASRELEEKAEMLFTDIYMARKDYDGALAHLDKFRKNYPQSKLVENVPGIIRNIEQVRAQAKNNAS